MTPQQVAQALDGNSCGRTVLAPGPGHSPNDRSMSITLHPSAPDGFLVNSFAGDDFKDCRDYIKDRLGISQTDYAPKARIAPPRKAEPKSDMRDIALNIWSECRPIGGTLAEQYLEGRGCALEVLPEDLQYHPALRFQGNIVPGMVALMRDIRTNGPTGIHRTFLKPDGTKLDRRMLGPAKGACVKLTPDADVTHGLGIAEGVETSLSIMKAGFAPMWACLSAGTVARFPLLAGIEVISVFADNDESGTGQDAAIRCIDTWKADGREARAVMPKSHGDFNDRGVL